MESSKRDKANDVLVEHLSSGLTSSPMSFMAGGGLGNDTFNHGVNVENQPQTKEEKVSRELPPGKVKAARPRGGGIEQDGVDSHRDYRRFSMTTMPPEHQPAYQPKHATELPSDERPSGSSVGVGSLPGNCNEFGVARLPDERGEANPYVYSHATVFETVFAPYRSLKSMLKRQGKDMQLQPDSQLPTKEVPTGSSVGVGSLPGDNNESGVATLPEERHDGKPCGSGYTGFESYSPGEGAKMMKKQRRLSNREQIEQYFEHCGQRAMLKVDLPLEEEPSGSRVGIGSLPGPNSEIGVAILPEEHKHHFDSEVDPSLRMPSTEVITDSYGGIGSLPGPRNEQRVAMTPEERLFPADGILGSRLPPRMDQMPLEEHPSGSVVGVGSLPGTIEESGVAVLPDERAQLDSTSASQVEFNVNKDKDAVVDEEKAKKARQDKQTTKRNMVKKSEVIKGAAGHDSKWIKSLGLERKGGMKVDGREQEERPKYSNHDKVIRYFQKSDHHVMPKVDLPSREEPSGSYEGVGSLPGPRHEAGVALLPEEKRRHLSNEVHPSLFMPSTEDQMNSFGGVGTLPGKRSEHGVALLPEERLFPADEILGSHLPPRADQLPSKEHTSGSPVGVGSLPGKRCEHGVALTPEERLHPADKILGSHLPPRMDQMPSMEHRSGSTVGVGSLPGQRTEKGVALTPEERHNPADQILMRKNRKQQTLSGKGGHGHSRVKSEANLVRAHTSGFRVRSSEAGVRRRQVIREDDRPECGTQDAASPPALQIQPTLDESHQQQQGDSGGQNADNHPSQPCSSWKQLSPDELEAERRKAEYAFEMARRTAGMLGLGMTKAVEGVGKVATAISAPRSYQPPTREEMEADRLMAQRRGEMMRDTVGRFESGIGSVGKRVKQTLGWEQSDGSPVDASQDLGSKVAGAADTGSMSTAATSAASTLTTGIQSVTSSLKQKKPLSFFPSANVARSGAVNGQSATENVSRGGENVSRMWNRDERERLNREMDTERNDEEVNRTQAQQRADMISKTMEGLGEWSTATAEGLGKGIGDMSQRVGDMGHRVWQSMGLRSEASTSLPITKEGVVNVLDMSYFMTIPDSAGPTTSSPSMYRMPSSLRPTAPEFVPKWRATQQQQQSEQNSGRSSWWPTTASAPPSFSNAMKDVREKLEGYLHLGHSEEGQQDKGANEPTPERSSVPCSTHSASTMDTLAGHNTRAPDVDDERSAELHDRVVDACDTISSATADTANEDDEEKMRKVGEAEELLSRVGQGAGRAGNSLGGVDDKDMVTQKATSLQRSLPSENTIQKEAGAEGEVTTLADSARLGSTRAPLGMPTREAEAQTSVPGNLHEQYFLACEAGAEGEVAAMGDAGELGNVRLPHGMEQLTGVGGVGFSMQPGEGGVLPGYPTPDGMSQLLQQRIIDDQVRQARAAGQQGVETSTNTLKSVPHIEPTGPVQVPAPLQVGAPANVENLSVPASASQMGFGRTQSDISIQSVRGSVSDFGADDFTGNKTPRAVEATSPMGMLGAPLGGSQVKGQQEMGGYLAPKQRN